MYEAIAANKLPYRDAACSAITSKFEHHAMESGWSSMTFSHASFKEVKGISAIQAPVGMIDTEMIRILDWLTFSDELFGDLLEFVNQIARRFLCK